MPVPRTVFTLALLALVAGLAAPTANAAEHAPRACLDKAEQRAAVAGHRAVPLAQAIRSLHRHGRRGEVVRAALCRRDGRLVYELTFLARSGAVTRVSVDAANGEPLGGR